MLYGLDMVGQYSAVQYSTVQCSTVQYSTVQCSTLEYDALLYPTTYATGYIWPDAMVKINNADVIL